MFYQPNARDRSVLPHDPFKAIIAPRPIGWVSTMSSTGAVNLAPYSFFNAFADRPPIIAFSSVGEKDSVVFARETNEFVWNLASYALRDAMNATSASIPRGDSEFAHAGLKTAPCKLVRAPRVADSPCSLECVVIEIKALRDKDDALIDCYVVFGQVVGVHIADDYIRDGRFDTAKAAPMTRAGYHDYSVADKMFELVRPG